MKNFWQRGAEVMSHLLLPHQTQPLIQAYISARTRVFEVEELLEEAVEFQLLLLQVKILKAPVSYSITMD